MQAQATLRAALRSPRLLRPGRPSRALWPLAQASLFLLLVVIWQLVAISNPILTIELSTPVKVAEQLRDWLNLDGWGQVWITISTALAGLVVGTALACLATAVLASSRLLRAFMAPFIVVLNAIPRIALAPLFILWFGIDARAGVAFVVVITFFVVFVNLFTGIEQIEPLLLMNARTLGASRLWLLREVYLPSVLVWLLASLRNTVALALLGAAVAELIAGTAGLGYLMGQGTNNGDSAEVIGAALILAAITLVASGLIDAAERRLLAWKGTVG